MGRKLQITWHIRKSARLYRGEKDRHRRSHLHALWCGNAFNRGCSYNRCSFLPSNAGLPGIVRVGCKVLRRTPGNNAS